MTSDAEAVQALAEVLGEHADHMEDYALPHLDYMGGYTHALNLLRRDAGFIAAALLGALDAGTVPGYGPTAPACQACGGTGERTEAHDGGYHMVHCECTYAREPTVQDDGLCDMCGHEDHADTDCGVSVGYDHLNGYHECGCPGFDPLVEALRGLAMTWTSGGWSDVLLPKPTPPAVPVIVYANRMGDWLREQVATLLDEHAGGES